MYREKMFKMVSVLFMCICLSLPGVPVLAEEEMSAEQKGIINGDSAGDYNEIVPSEIEQLMSMLITKDAETEESRNLIKAKISIINEISGMQSR